eukprot:5273433-Prymnesium_polylepis.1
MCYTDWVAARYTRRAGGRTAPARVPASPSRSPCHQSTARRRYAPRVAASHKRGPAQEVDGDHDGVTR